ncbi:hypothetical protein, partial [Motilibacter aurantiacus]|uniref:hypothetical protein n=1 Tax=Motilibacter aurantiacus TaxID=2714955 RepID=UPI001E651425
HRGRGIARPAACCTFAATCGGVRSVMLAVALVVTGQALHSSKDDAPHATAWLDMPDEECTRAADKPCVGTGEC